MEIEVLRRVSPEEITKYVGLDVFKIGPPDENVRRWARRLDIALPENLSIVISKRWASIVLQAYLIRIDGEKVLALIPIYYGRGFVIPKKNYRLEIKGISLPYLDQYGSLVHPRIIHPSGEPLGGCDIYTALETLFIQNLLKYLGIPNFIEHKLVDVSKVRGEWLFVFERKVESIRPNELEAILSYPNILRRVFEICKKFQINPNFFKIFAYLNFELSIRPSDDFTVLVQLVDLDNVYGIHPQDSILLYIPCFFKPPERLTFKIRYADIIKAFEKAIEKAVAEIVKNVDHIDPLIFPEGYLRSEFKIDFEEDGIVEIRIQLEDTSIEHFPVHKIVAEFV